MGSSSSQQPVTQQTQATRDPWAPAQPYLQKAMTRAGSFFDDGQCLQNRDATAHESAERASQNLRAAYTIGAQAAPLPAIVERVAG